MWQPATERLQHFQTMLKTKLNGLTLKKEPLPTVIFHEPEGIELCSTTLLLKNRAHAGYKVTYLGNVTISGSEFLSGCTEPAVIGLWERRAQAPPGHALLEIRPFQVRLHHLDGRPDPLDAYQVARIAYCTADHGVSPDVFAWIYRQINDDLTFQLDCHAVQCESRLEAKRLAHSMMEAFRQAFHSMRSGGRVQPSPSSRRLPDDDVAPDDDG